MTKDLNLAKTYVSNWGLWEVLRELLANAEDAGPYDSLVGSDALVLTSPSFPALEHMLIMGHGTKHTGGGTIGQFGEGLKLAALVATRNEWGLKFTTPTHHVRFEWRTAEGFDVETLHAVIQSRGSEVTDPCFTVSMQADGLGELIAANVLPRGTPAGPLLNTQRTHEGQTLLHPVVIYHRGLRVCELPDKGIYDWNLKDLELNRDRSVPERGGLLTAVAMEMLEQMKASDMLCDQMLSHPAAFETVAAGSIWYERALRTRMTAAFRRAFGDRAVLSAQDTTRDGIATRLGFRVVSFDGNLRYMLAGTGFVQTAEQVQTAFDGLTETQSAIPAAVQAEFEWLVDFLGVQGRLVLMRDGQDAPLGLARWRDTAVELWLNERLLLPGCRTQRWGTLCHELGHIQGAHPDGSLGFEDSLSSIAGKLAVALYDRGTRRRRATT